MAVSSPELVARKLVEDADGKLHYVFLCKEAFGDFLPPEIVF